jgi:hypothetical protein
MINVFLFLISSQVLLLSPPSLHISYDFLNIFVGWFKSINHVFHMLDDIGRCHRNFELHLSHDYTLNLEVFQKLDFFFVVTVNFSLFCDWNRFWPRGETFDLRFFWFKLEINWNLLIIIKKPPVLLFNISPYQDLWFTDIGNPKEFPF